eukprot:CFRG7651T1
MAHLVTSGDFGLHRLSMSLPTRMPNLPNLDVFGGMDKKDVSLRDKLESNNPKDALSAMKQCIAMLSSGQDIAYLMPSVVKQVVSPDVEVKKLAYMYLVRYAEEEPDIALLSINSFQKDLKGPNQFIRASALRVMSSIRVDAVVPLMVLAVKQTVSDLSPYVRKVTAHALPKIYSIDGGQKEELCSLIEKLLDDRAVLVLGSAIYAFESVCPDRLDMLHKHFRKLCETIVDFDEWGQIVSVNLLTRYARTQFVNPNKNEDDMDTSEIADDKPFYSDSESNSSDSESEVDMKLPPQMDPDHRLLLNTVKPLLLSRNSGVVFAVAQLYYYLAPRAETSFVGQAMVRLVGLQREIASTVLSSVVTMSANRPQMFSPYLKSFFVRDDPVSVSLAKITVMVNLVSENNISIVLSEFASCIRSVKSEVALAAIDGVGLCAQKFPNVTPSCIRTLTAFLSSGCETIAGHCIVVIKRLLQQPAPSQMDITSASDSEGESKVGSTKTISDQEHRESVAKVIRSLAKLLMKGHITVPLARASVTWLVGEHAIDHPKLGPDVLRVQIKDFASMEKVEKLQILNLATKLYLVRAKRSERYLNYALMLAKYDSDYDIRDKSRFIVGILSMKEKNIQYDRLKRLILCSKPPPALPAKPPKDDLQLGTLSQVVGRRLPGYQALPDFPAIAPDGALRQVAWDRHITEMSLSGRAGGFGMFPKSNNDLMSKTNTDASRSYNDRVKDDSPNQGGFYSSDSSRSGSSSGSEAGYGSDSDSYDSRSGSGSGSEKDSRHGNEHNYGGGRAESDNSDGATSRSYSSSGSDSEDDVSSSNNLMIASSMQGSSNIARHNSDSTDSSSGSDSDARLRS